MEGVMPLVDPNDDLMMNEFINSVPGLPQELLAEAEENGAQVDPDDPYAWVRESAKQLYPTDPLSDDEIGEYSRLSNRAQRLAPIEQAQFGEVGSARIAGNPYSIDTRSAAQGVRNLVAGVINKVRDNRRGEFEDDLTKLANRRSRNVENADKQQAWLEKMYPEVFGEMQQNKRNEADNTSRFNLEENKAGWRKELENLKHQNALELEKLENTNSGDFSPSIVTNFSNRSKDTGQQLFNQVEAIDEVLNDEFMRPADEKRVEELQKERDQKYRLGFEFMQLGQQALTNGLNRNLQSKADSLYNKAINMDLNDDPAGSGSNGNNKPYTEDDIQNYADDYGLTFEEAKQAFESDFN